MEGRKFLLRILNVASSVCLGVLFVYFFISPDIEVPVDAIIPIYYLLFALLILLSDFRVPYVDEKFKFMRKPVGRGLFMILVGGMALRVFELMNLIVAGVLVANGLITWSWKDTPEVQSKYAAIP